MENNTQKILTALASLEHTLNEGFQQVHSRMDDLEHKLQEVQARLDDAGLDEAEVSEAADEYQPARSIPQKPRGRKRKTRASRDDEYKPSAEEDKEAAKFYSEISANRAKRAAVKKLETTSSVVPKASTSPGVFSAEDKRRERSETEDSKLKASFMLSWNERPIGGGVEYE